MISFVATDVVDYRPLGSITMPQLVVGLVGAQAAPFGSLGRLCNGRSVVVGRFTRKGTWCCIVN